MGFGGRGMLLLCVGAVVLQYLLYAAIVASHDRIGEEIAAALDTRDGAFVRSLDHSQHSHHEGGKKSFEDIKNFVEELAVQVEHEEAQERAFEEKLQRIINGTSPRYCGLLLPSLARLPLHALPSHSSHLRLVALLALWLHMPSVNLHPSSHLFLLCGNIGSVWLYVGMPTVSALLNLAGPTADFLLPHAIHGCRLLLTEEQESCHTLW